MTLPRRAFALYGRRKAVAVVPSLGRDYRSSPVVYPASDAGDKPTRPRMALGYVNDDMVTDHPRFLGIAAYIDPPVAQCWPHAPIMGRRM